jgi:hypothetical protein
MARPAPVAVVLHLMIARERLPSHFLPDQLLSILPSKTVTHTIQVDLLSVFLRKWILDNPELSPEVQHNNVFAAIARGEITCADETFLNPTLYHYWWRRAYEEKSQPADDPWENMGQTLEKHRSVILSSLSRSF